MTKKIFIFGYPKTGKSTAFSQIDGATYVDLDNGLNFIKTAEINKVQAISEVKPCDTVILDSITRLQYLSDRHICTKENVDSISDIAYGKGTKASSMLTIKTLEKIQTLSVKNMIVIGHCSLAHLSKDTGSKTVKQIKLHNDTMDYIASYFDCIAYFENQTVYFDKSKATRVGGCRFTDKQNMNINDFIALIK